MLHIGLVMILPYVFLLSILALNPQVPANAVENATSTDRELPGFHTNRPPEGALEVPSIPQSLEKSSMEQPWFIRMMVSPMRRGIFIRMPVLDTDPNSGIRYGFMPIWVIQEPNGDRIKHIYAPSLTYNAIFKLEPAYRYYYYPSEDSSVVLHGSISQVVNREIFAQYENFDLLDRGLMSSLHFRYYVDGSSRFYGIGPDSPKRNETNYIQDFLEYYAAFGVPILPNSPWHLNISVRLAAQNISNGPINSIPDISQKFPDVSPFHRQQDAETRLFMNYDTRDSPITTTEGTFLELFGERSKRNVASAYNFRRYGIDMRYFYQRHDDDRLVTAGRLKFEQLLGNSLPFWIMPQLGGKYTQRAYGEGRYVDKGLITATIEERFTAFEAKLTEVTTRFEMAPFVGLGAVFPSVEDMARRYTRPVYGIAFRAVAPPQVVGSIDVGVGQEGAAVFMDINYSF